MNKQLRRNDNVHVEVKWSPHANSIETRHDLQNEWEGKAGCFCRRRSFYFCWQHYQHYDVDHWNRHRRPWKNRMDPWKRMKFVDDYYEMILAQYENHPPPIVDRL